MNFILNLQLALQKQLDEISFFKNFIVNGEYQVINLI
jgi:hypothetical protein